MSSPLDRTPKWVRDERRVQEVIGEIQELIEKPEFHQPSPAAPPPVEDGGLPGSLALTLMPEATSVHLCARRVRAGAD